MVSKIQTYLFEEGRWRVEAEYKQHKLYNHTILTVKKKKTFSDCVWRGVRAETVNGYKGNSFVWRVYTHRHRDELARTC